MKILQIAPPWIPIPPSGYGGTEAIIDLLTNHLIQKGHDVTLFSTGNSKTPAKLKYVFKEGLAEQGIAWSAALPVFLHYHQAFELIRKHDFDMVHAHPSSPTDLFAIAFLSTLRRIGKPSVMTLHCPLPLDSFTHMDHDYLRYYGKDVPLINISKSMQARAPKRFMRTSVVYNALEIGEYTYNPSPKGNYLSWLGKIVPHKGLLEAIQLAKQTKQQLIFAGVIDTNNPDSVQYYENKIKKLIDGKQIQFIGPANLKQKNELFGNSKAFLNPILWDEPFGLVMIEAMASGTPVITYNRGAAPEVVRHGKTGFVVNTKAEMIDAIKNIDTIKRAECRKLVETKFSGEVMADNYLKAYAKVQTYFKNS